MGLWTKQQLREFIKENKLVTAQDAQNNGYKGVEVRGNHLLVVLPH